MDHRLFKRVSAASAPQFLSLFFSSPCFLFASSCHSSVIQRSPPEVWALSLSPPPTPLLILCALSLLPLLPPLHHCCLMPACMTAANWSHRWTEKLRFRAESQTKQTLLNDDDPATFNRHFRDSLYLCFSLFWSILFAPPWSFSFYFCGYAARRAEKTGSFFDHVPILLHVQWWQPWASLFTCRHALGLLFLNYLSVCLFFLSDWLCVLFLANRHTEGSFCSNSHKPSDLWFLVHWKKYTWMWGGKPRTYL